MNLVAHKQRCTVLITVVACCSKYRGVAAIQRFLSHLNISRNGQRLKNIESLRLLHIYIWLRYYPAFYRERFKTNIVVFLKLFRPVLNIKADRVSTCFWRSRS